MKKRGEIVKERILEKGIKITALAEMLDSNTTTMYRHLNSEMDWDEIRKIGEIINHDFSQDFPDMPKSPHKHNTTVIYAEEENAQYQINSVEELRKMVGFWKDKYMKSIEDMNRLLSKQLNKS